MQTMNETTARQQQSFDREVVGLLDGICQELEITEAMFKTAEQRYTNIAEYLGAADSPLVEFRPAVYAQGSINLETTVKPIGDSEFDVDTICQLQVSERAPQEAFKDLIYKRLEQRGIYTLRKMNRCVRVQYANEFHIDITPGIPDVDQGPENILVTDKELGRWKESNPKDYATWFKKVAKLQPTLLYESREIMKALAAAEPLPAPKFTKPTLNRVIQLMKRHRDMMFEGHKDAPISAIITTLAARSYEEHVRTGQFPNQVEFLQTVIAAMPDFITKINGDELVPNPSNPLENFADKWKAKPQRRIAFHKWHEAAVTHLEDILDTIGVGKDALFKSLSESYGTDVVKRATVKQAELRKALSERQELGVTKNTGYAAPIVVGSPAGRAVLPVRKHTNLGI